MHWFYFLSHIVSWKNSEKCSRNISFWVSTNYHLLLKISFIRETFLFFSFYKLIYEKMPFNYASSVFVKVSVTDIWLYGIWCEPLVEETVRNFRVLFLTETDLKSFLMYCDKFRQWNQQCRLALSFRTS